MVAQIDTSIGVLSSIYALLDGDAALQALLGGAGRVHTRPQEGLALPFVVIRDDFPRDWIGGQGMEHTIDVHVFSDDDSDLQALQIRSRVFALVNGHKVSELDAQSICIYFDSAVMLPRETGKGGAHGVASFIVRAEGV